MLVLNITIWLKWLLIIIFLNLVTVDLHYLFSYYNNMKNSLWAFIGLAGLTWALFYSCSMWKKILTVCESFIETDFTGNTYPGTSSLLA